MAANAEALSAAPPQCKILEFNVGAINVGGIRSSGQLQRGGQRNRCGVFLLQQQLFRAAGGLTVFLLFLLPAVIYLSWVLGGTPPTIEGIKMNDNHVITQATSQRRKFLLF